MEEKDIHEKLIQIKHKNKMKEIEAEKKAKLEIIEAEMKLEDTRYDHIMSNYRIKRADRNREGPYT